LLLWARRAGDIDRQRRPPGTQQHGAQQHGVQQEMRAVSRCRLTYEAEYRLVDIFCSVVGAVAAMYCFVLFTVKYFTMPTGQRDDEKCPLVYRFHTALLPHLQSRSMKLSSIRQSVRLSVRPSFGRRTPLRRVCCCAHGGQEISIDYYTAGAQQQFGQCHVDS